jgi:2-polyprenyl-6-methoxyphenol hydroxylase-like FAD-dependent oxidoreductase
MVAACNVSGYRRRDEDIYVSYGEPGRQVSRFAMHDDRTLFLFVWRDDEGVDAHADSLKQRREAMLRRFAGMGWETGDILAAITESDDLYVDRVSQIHMPRWSRDRIALVGDAAFCPSLLAGEGSALAMTAAYVLAGELRLADWDHAAAFARYEQKLRPFIEKKQKAAADFAAAFAPKTRLGIALRNLVTRAFVIPGVADLAIGSSLKDDFALPMYAL